MKASNTIHRELYYQLENSASHNLHLSDDEGLVPSDVTTPFLPIEECKWNEDSPIRGIWPCGRCEVCLGYGLGRRVTSIVSRILDPTIHPMVSFTLSLPKWPVILPVINNCKNVGELLYWTPALLDGDCLGMRDILNAYRKIAFNVVESIFPDTRIGVALFLHLANDYLQFSPHLHGIICSTGIAEEYWPLKMVNGEFPELGQGWRRVLGKEKMPLRDLKNELQIGWADAVGNYFQDILSVCKQNILPGIQTKNIGYQFLKNHPGVVNNVGHEISSAIRADKKCVYVKWMKVNSAIGLEEPVAALGNVVGYGASGNLKTTQFEKERRGRYSVFFKKSGSNQSCGKHDVLCRRLAQLRYASKGVRRYQLKGLFGAALGGRGTPYGRALTQEMNKGYPRTQQGAQ